MEHLADKLIEAGLIDIARLNQARVESGMSGQSIWVYLVKNGMCTEEDLMRFFAAQANVPFVSVREYSVKQEVLNLVEEYFCREHVCIPLFRVGDVLYLACRNPFDAMLLDSVHRITGLAVEPLLAAHSAILEALDHYWRLDESYFEVRGYIGGQGSVKGIPFCRESERLPVSLPVSIGFVAPAEVTVTDNALLRGTVRDISGTCSAVGIALPVYLPRSITLELKIDCGRSAGSAEVDVRGEVIHCFYKQKQYIIGVKLEALDAASCQRLLACARKPA